MREFTTIGHTHYQHEQIGRGWLASANLQTLLNGIQRCASNQENDAAESSENWVDHADWPAGRLDVKQITNWSANPSIVRLAGRRVSLAVALVTGLRSRMNGKKESNDYYKWLMFVLFICKTFVARLSLGPNDAVQEFLVSHRCCRCRRHNHQDNIYKYTHIFWKLTTWIEFVA